MVSLIATNRATIQKVADGTQSLRGLYPQFNAARSFLDSIKSDTSHEHDLSIMSERQFEFDDVVTSSQAYRRVLVAATHTLRNNREQAPGGGTTIEGGLAGQENSSPQGANQSRKMNAGVPSQTGGLVSQSKGSPSSDTQLGESNSQSSTFRDSSSFAQQFRGYLDHVEGELRETAKLRAMLQEKDAEVGRLQKDLEGAFEKVRITQHALQTSSTEVVRLRAEIKDLLGKQSQFDGRLASLRGEADEREKNLKERVAEYQRNLEEMDAEYQAFQRYSKRKYEKDVEYLQCELDTTEQKIREGEIEYGRLYQNAKNLEDSIGSSRTTQLGRILLVPMQSPAWLDKNIKGPPQFQVLSAPENPDGSAAKWDGESSQPCSSKDLSLNQGQENKWLFANETGKIEEPSTAPSVPAMSPDSYPETAQAKKSEKEKPEAPAPPTTHYPSPVTPKTFREWRGTKLKRSSERNVA